MEQVRLCAVWPLENWLGSSLNQLQGCTTVRESYSRALEQGPLGCSISSVTLVGLTLILAVLLSVRYGLGRWDFGRHG